MGNLHVNFTVKRDNPQAIASTLRNAGPTHDGTVCLWAREEPVGNSAFVRRESERVPLNLLVDGGAG